MPVADQRPAYARSGVDVAAGERAVALMRQAVDSTRRAEVVGGLGGFSGAVTLPSGLRDPLLVSATDGVGTKTAIARSLERFDTIGVDLVAMCADDVVCSGAEPLFFLDYIAVGQLDPFSVAELVGGVAAGCREAGCALVGGETAEHPGIMEVDEFDIAGFCVGVVERDRLLDGAAVEAGDAIIGLGSSGLHANGFSLVRTTLAQYDIDLGASYQERLRLTLGDAATQTILEREPEHALATIGEVLLTPSRIYASPVLRLRDGLALAGFELHAIAHITGGGLPGNLPRALPDALAARIDPSCWPVPSVMSLFAALAGMEDDEMRGTFNGGVGMALVVERPAVEAALALLEESGVPAWRIGDVVPGASLADQRYAEEPLQR